MKSASLKVGDRVRLLATYPERYQPAGGFRKRTGSVVAVSRDNADVRWDGLIEGWSHETSACNMWNVEYEYLKREPKRVSISASLALKPQAKTVLLHLKKHGRISHGKADRVYGFTRLAAQIHEIRAAGYNITTNRLRDDQGRQYAEYVLAA